MGAIRWIGVPADLTLSCPKCGVPVYVDAALSVEAQLLLNADETVRAVEVELVMECWVCTWTWKYKTGDDWDNWDTTEHPDPNPPEEEWLWA